MLCLSLRLHGETETVHVHTQLYSHGKFVNSYKVFPYGAVQLRRQCFLWGSCVQDGGRSRLTSTIMVFDLYLETWEEHATTGVPPPVCIYKTVLSVEENTHAAPCLLQAQCCYQWPLLSSCSPITCAWSAWDWVKRQENSTSGFWTTYTLGMIAHWCLNSRTPHQVPIACELHRNWFV